MNIYIYIYIFLLPFKLFLKNTRDNLSKKVCFFNLVPNSQAPPKQAQTR